jgi:hypothetical protein
MPVLNIPKYQRPWAEYSGVPQTSNGYSEVLKTCTIKQCKGQMPAEYSEVPEACTEYSGGPETKTEYFGGPESKTEYSGGPETKK